MSSSDLYISFGADTSGLEASLAVAKAEVTALAREMAALGREMAATGASADSALGQSLRAAAETLVAARGHAAELKTELGEIGKGGEGGGFLGSLKSGLEGGLSGLTSFKVGLAETAELLAATFAVEKIAQFAESMAELGTQTIRAATILGVPTEQIGALRLMAQASGIDLDTLTLSFSRLSRNIVDETPNSKRALDALGLAFTDLKNKGAEQQLGTLADAFSKIQDGATKDAIAMELFGRAGMQMLPMLNEGRGAIEEWKNAAEAAGVALDSSMVAAMENTHHELLTLSAAIEGVSVAAFGQLHDQIDGAVKILADFSAQVARSIGEGGFWAAVLDEVKQTFIDLELGVAKSIQQLTDFNTIASEVTTQVQIAFEGMGRNIAEVFKALVTGIGNFFSGLVSAGSAATSLVGQEFVNMAGVISSAMGGDFAGAKAAFGRMGADATTAGATIKGAFAGAMAGFDFSKVGAGNDLALERMRRTTETANREMLASQATYNAEERAVMGTQYKLEESRAAQHAATMAAASHGGRGHGRGGRGGSADLAPYEEEIRAIHDVANEKQKALDDALAHHRISSSAWLSDSEAVLNREAADVKASFDQEIALAGVTEKQREQIKIKEADALRAINDKIVADERKAADESQKAWEAAANTITGAFNSQLRGLLQGTTSWSQAMKSIGLDLTMKMIEYGEKKVIQWAFGEMQQTAATLTGTATREAASATAAGAGTAQMIPNAIKAITVEGAQTFGGIFAFLSPFLGPAAAGPAAAGEAMVLGAASFDIGAWSIPQNQLAMVHKSELVMPAAEAGAFRSMLSANARGDGGGQGGGRSVSVNPSVNLNVSAVDGASVLSILKGNSRALMQAINHAVTSGAHLGLRGLA